MQAAVGISLHVPAHSYSAGTKFTLNMGQLVIAAGEVIGDALTGRTKADVQAFADILHDSAG
jgi:hypothetical protein